MTRNWLLPALVAIAAVAFAAGALCAQPREASAQTTLAASTLPPIFQEGNVVAFSDQGPNLTIVQVYGNWVCVVQQSRGGYETSAEQKVKSQDTFWICPERFQESWRLVKQ